MSGKNKTLPLGGCVELINKMVNDMISYTYSDTKIPDKMIYKVASKEEHCKVTGSARKAAFEQIGSTGLKKVAFVKNDPAMICQDKYAFDTRKINQKSIRNPRSNLQYWNRSQQFIDDEDANKLNAFAKLLEPLEEIKKQFGSEPEYFESYARTLDDLVSRVCQVDKEDVEVFKPQLAYLEQLLFARYRLSLEDITKMSGAKLKKRLLQKDEHLLKRGKYQDITKKEIVKKEDTAQLATKDGNSTQENIINAIFGDSIRRRGDRAVERTITIKIRDEVIE